MSSIVALTRTSRLAVLALLLTVLVVLSTAFLGATAAVASGTDTAAVHDDTTLQSAATATDSDSDGLTDREEVNGWGTDPNNADTDGDGTDDGAETVDGTARTDLHTLRVTKVRAEDGRADYSLTTSGQLSGLSDFEDTLNGNTASGRVGPTAGNDTVAFAGETTSFSLDGPAVLYLDGTVVQPSDLQPETHVLSVTKNGAEDGKANYELVVNGTLTPRDDFEDTINNTAASGSVGPQSGTDSVEFTGEITSLSLDGPAVITLDGQEIDPSTYGNSPETHTLVVTKDGAEDGKANYQFSVDGTLTPRDDFEDTINNTAASGRVGPTAGTDSVEFTGNVTSFSLDGPAVVTLDGEKTDPRALGTTPIEFNQTYEGDVSGDERHVYTFSVDQDAYIRIPFGGAPDTARATLYAPSGTELDTSVSYADTIPFGAQAPETGTYRIVVTEHDDAFSGYHFEVNTARPDGFEPDDDQSSATTLASGQPDEAILGEGEHDWFALDAQSGEQITVDLRRHSNNFGSDVAVALVAPDGSELTSDTSSCGVGMCDPDDLTVTAATNGTYYVRVSGDSTEGFISYEVNATAV
ncbi:pre-peptidase [Halogeometricum borinquense]|uniref:Pre-peptidase n=1 Tax=Halogeometricum borinquense TaxID=60847 RepID=A0A6C0UCN0_9EURY|nr:thrombospondin type 3 repeat-containing protein [Halogeometricum borinquense]QIB73076.1 pre-peptidase [Halogeometricum borinquense]QIQ77803.1 pre-peptidase [Halogeometricum borinquense]